MWEQVKRAVVESAREVCGSVMVGGRNPKSVWWDDEVRERGLFGRKCCEPEMNMQKKDVWKFTKKKR